jgi:hypothetical protein
MFTPIVNVIAGIFQPCAFDTLTVDATAGGIGLTEAKYHPLGDEGSDRLARSVARVVITVEAASIRYTYDGTTVTASVGHLLNSGDVLVLVGEDAIKNFRAIRTTGTSGTIQCTYER